MLFYLGSIILYGLLSVTILKCVFPHLMFVIQDFIYNLVGSFPISLTMVAGFSISRTPDPPHFISPVYTHSLLRMIIWIAVCIKKRYLAYLSLLNFEISLLSFHQYFHLIGPEKLLKGGQFGVPILLFLETDPLQ